MKTLVDYIFESHTVKNKQFIKLLDNAGFHNVYLEDDSGTIYVFDDESLASGMYDNSWGAVRFSDQSKEQWVLDIAIKYFNEIDFDELSQSKNIKPNFDYLYKLCDKLGKDSSYYKKELDKYKDNYENI